jgi:hypothetical protein
MCGGGAGVQAQPVDIVSFVAALHRATLVNCDLSDARRALSIRRRTSTARKYFRVPFTSDLPDCI